jgi:hypothetical protein
MDTPSEPTTMRDSSAAAAQAAATPNPAPAPGERQPDTADLLEQLRQDRLWLLRQLDSGRWPQWRLDLAALERELGHLLDQATEGLPRS